MFKDIIIGQYVPGNSPLHKMNPPVKIIMTILYIVLLFILKNPISYVVFTIYTITLILISGVPFKMILKGLKPMLWIFIFTGGFILWSGELPGTYCPIIISLNIAATSD